VAQGHGKEWRQQARSDAQDGVASTLSAPTSVKSNGRGDTEPVRAARDSHENRPEGDTHIVHAGETLWGIGVRMAGPGAGPAAVAKRVQRLWDLNARAIGTGNPDLLPVGTVLRLPE